MSISIDPTRRRVLWGGVALLAGATAGCTSNGTGTPTPLEESVFRGTSFDGPDLVVELRAEHGVSRVNLMGPDGSAVGGANVSAGATTARIPTLRIQPATGFRHYEPGIHELVAILGERTESVDLELRPELRVTAIEPYREGAQSSDAGRLAVMVENVGNAPTWVYDVTYRDAPNETANDELSDDPGAPFLHQPTETGDIIIGTNERQTYIGVNVPLLFSDDDQSQCGGTVEFTVVVGRAVGAPIELQIRATLGEDVQSAGLTGEYTCSAIVVEQLEGGANG